MKKPMIKSYGNRFAAGLWRANAARRHPGRAASAPPIIMQRESTETAPICCCHSMTTELCSPRFDMHYALELGIKVAGTATRFYNKWQMDIGPGEVWFAGAWELHGYSILETPCEGYVFSIHPDSMMCLPRSGILGFDWMAPFVVPPANRPRVPPRDREEVLRMAQRLGLPLRSGEVRLGLSAQLVVMEIIAFVCRNWTGRNIKGARRDIGAWRLCPAIDLVLANRRHITEKEAAAACSIGVTMFNRMFTETMGLTFFQFALRHRLSRAKQELLKRPAPCIKTVASEWGFVDHSHFTNCFQRHYGCSPSSYRSLQLASNSSQPVG